VSRLRSYLSLLKRIWHAPGNRGRRLAVIVRSAAWLANKWTMRQPWTLRVFNGLRLRCYPDSIIALHVIQRSEYHDWDTAHFIYSFLHNGDVFVDAGANIGLYTLPAAALGADVIAVEPSAKNRGRLEENLLLNDLSRVRIEPCALGAQEGEMAFCDADALAHVQAQGSGPCVPLRSLDSLLPAAEISLLKVDVEGFELAVFKGATEAMRRGSLPVILFEMNQSYKRYGFTEEQVFSFLRSHGYKIARYEHDQRRLSPEHLQGDVLAYTPRGEQLITERLLSS
jgi:FkbM family methyltransferase